MAALRGESSGLLHAPEPPPSTGTHSNTYATARSTLEIFSIRLNLLFTEINLEDRQAGLFGRTVPSSLVTTKGCGNRKALPRSLLFPRRQLALAISRRGKSRRTQPATGSLMPFTRDRTGRCWVPAIQESSRLRDSRSLLKITLRPRSIISFPRLTQFLERTCLMGVPSDTPMNSTTNGRATTRADRLLRCTRLTPSARSL